MQTMGINVKMAFLNTSVSLFCFHPGLSSTQTTRANLTAIANRQRQKIWPWLEIILMRWSAVDTGLPPRWSYFSGSTSPKVCSIQLVRLCFLSLLGPNFSSYNSHFLPVLSDTVSSSSLRMCELSQKLLLSLSFWICGLWFVGLEQTAMVTQEIRFRFPGTVWRNICRANNMWLICTVHLMLISSVSMLAHHSYQTQAS